DTAVLSKLAGVATGNVLISGGVGTAPSWGKVTLGTHTSGNYVSSLTGTANQVTVSASTGDVTLSQPQDIAAASTPQFAGLTLTGDHTLNAQSDLRFADADSSNWIAFQAPTTIADNVTWTLPNADSSGCFQSDGAGAVTLDVCGGTSELSGITAASGNASINNAANNITWNWALTAAESGITFSENTASSGGSNDQNIVQVGTLATSTARPLYVQNLGAGRSFQVDDEASDTTPFIIDASGNVGVGTTTANAGVEILKTTEQLRLSYDTSNRSSFAVDSTANLNIDNYATANDTTLTIENSDGTKISNLSVEGQVRVGQFASAPTTLGSGALYWDTANSKMYINNGSSWTGVGASTFFSNSNDAVASGSYIDIAHNQNTNDVLPGAWVYNTDSSKWEKIDIQGDDTENIDLMEYTSNANAQAAYVTDGLGEGTGGTITYSGGYTIHTFTSSGTFNPGPEATEVEYLVVAGGGGGGSGGGYGGGGGAGGFRTATGFAVTEQGYTVTVGAGGAGGASNNIQGTNGSDSVFSTITSTGGGGGGTNDTDGNAGGSGGGGGYITQAGGAGNTPSTSPSQGNNGGAHTSTWGAGGGGGAGAVGSNGSGNTGGVGGAGTASSISGSSVTYAGGGGGCGQPCSAGGAGGGGAGETPAVAGTANTGGGGGGSLGVGGNGGSGIVIVRYTTPTPYLQSYSESTLRKQGSYALKGIALITDSLNKTLTRTISPTLDLTNKTTIKLNMRASRTGSNIKIGIHDAGGTTTEITPSIASADTYQEVTWDISAVSNANKDAIDSIIITIVNADAENTFYIDNIYALKSDYRMEQIDANTVRLYNYSGTTQNMRANVVTAAAALSTNLFSNSSASVANGTYLEVAHNMASNAVISNGWVYNTNTTQWQKVDTADNSQTGNANTTPFTTEANYTQEDMAYSVTLTPSATSGEITLTLGSGNWNTDSRIKAGCRVAGNGGVANITGTPAAQTTITATTATDFTNTDAIASGSWNLYCTTFSGGVAKVNTAGGTATGGDITTSGGNTIHTFTTSGTFTTSSSANVEYLVVAGGGGGGGYIGSGGGAGGFRTATGFAVTAQGYSITVGAGGTGGTAQVDSDNATNGSDSIFSTITSTGGGRGANPYTTFGTHSTNGGAGGSGGGGANETGAGGAGTGGQGNAGGTSSATQNYGSSGGGGATAAGGVASGTGPAGAGGAGTASSISGSSVTYAGGGGGATFYNYGGDGGAGGGGQGATGGGASPTRPATAGTINTGGGGGGGAQGDGGSPPGVGGAGGSGIVIIAYTTGAFTSTTPTSTFYTVVTGTDQLDTSSTNTLDSVTVTETLNSQTINYAVSFDGRTTFVKYDSTASNAGWRPIARNNSGTWQYNSNSSAGVSNVTWTSATTNAMAAAISQAQGVAANNMTGTALSAVTASQFREQNGFINSLVSTIDFSQSFKTTDASQIPQVDDIAINYTKAGFKVVQTDTNTARLYNYTGQTQNLRLDVATASYTANVWSSLTSPAGNLSLSMGAYTNTLTFNDATSTSNLFNLTDTTSNTGTGYLLNVTTASSSTLKPFHVSAAGVEALVVDASGNVGIGTTSPGVKLDIVGNLQLQAQGDLRFADADSSNYLAFKSPATVGSNVTWTLPTADGTSGQVLSTDGAGNLSWVTNKEGVTQDFRGLTLRTATDGNATTKVTLLHADEILTSNGVKRTPADNLSASITTAGIGGLVSAESESASQWYRIFYSYGGSGEGLFLQEAKEYFLDEEQTATDSGMSLNRATAPTQTKIAQSFVPGTAGPAEFVDIILSRGASPVGRVWVTLEADSGGSPSGTPLATSDKLDESLVSADPNKAWMRFVFRSPATLSAATTYWLVIQSDRTASDTNLIYVYSNSAGGYTSGSVLKRDSGVWTAQVGYDLGFKLYVTTYGAAGATPAPPSGYDSGYAQIGWVYNGSGSDFKSFTQTNNTVRYDSITAASGITSTTQILTSLSTITPPGTLKTMWVLTNNTDAGSNRVHPYSCASNFCDGGAYWTKPTSQPESSIIDNIITEYQYNYVSVGAGTGTFYNLGYTWSASGGADLAEEYLVHDETIEAGDIVSLTDGGSLYIDRASSSSTYPVIGIISTKPGLTLKDWPFNNSPSNSRPVALTGRVPVKFSNENGDIKKGDRLTLSKTIPGYAMKQTRRGQSIGIALEDSKQQTDNTEQKILVFVNLGYWEPGAPNTINLDNIDLTVSQSTSGLILTDDSSDYSYYGLTLMGIKAISSLSGKWSIGEDGTVVVEVIRTKGLELIDEDTGEVYCVRVKKGNLDSSPGECLGHKSINKKANQASESDALLPDGQASPNDGSVGQVAGESVDSIPDATSDDPASGTSENKTLDQDGDGQEGAKQVSGDEQEEIAAPAPNGGTRNDEVIPEPEITQTPVENKNAPESGAKENSDEN
ncbi:MAG: hypothetical protein Q8P83_03470, partial [bacterium]|nr:hypothetical protein [bacterium]